MGRSVLAAVALVVILAADARPQERPQAQGAPKPSPSEGGQQNQERTQGERPAGTRATPFDALKRQEADAVARKAEEERQEKEGRKGIERAMVVATQKGADANMAVAYLTGVLAVVGAGQAALFIWQLVLVRRSVRDATRAADAARDAANTASSTARHQLRAYVGMHSVTISWVVGSMPDPLRTGHPVAGLVIKNYGQTPANDLIHVARLVISQHPDPADPMEISVANIPHAAKTIMFPGDEAGTAIERAVLTDVQWAAIHGEYRFYVHGLISYRDVFGAPHETRYRAVYAKHGQPPVSEEGVPLEHCKAGNEYT
jgi:hypothetical protein